MLFSGESDIFLERYRLLHSMVDLFVVTEAQFTFTGTHRSLEFEGLIAASNADANQICYLPVMESPVAENPWIREQFVRDYALSQLHSLPPDATVILSDVDEIPNPGRLKELAANLERPISLDMMYLMFSPNLHWKQVWRKPKLSRVCDIESIEALRQNDGLPIALAAGWHLSSQGTVSDNIRKLKSFSHTEMKDIADCPQHVEACIRLGVDLLGRGVLTVVNASELPVGILSGPLGNLAFKERSRSNLLRSYIYNFVTPGLRTLGFPSGILGKVFAVPVAALLRTSYLLKRCVRMLRRCRASNAPFTLPAR